MFLLYIEETVLCVLPLVAIWFGIGEDGKLFLIALGVFDPGRYTLLARNYADRGRDRCRELRYRIYGDERSRLHADGYHRAEHPDLRYSREAVRFDRQAVGDVAAQVKT